MATFEVVRSESHLLADAIRNLLGESAFLGVSVPEPQPPQDELYFRKLVSWSYVFLFESFPVVLKQIANLLRSASPADFSRFNTVKEAVNALRTQQSHALTKSPHDQRTRTTADAWLVQYGTDADDWRGRCDSLSLQMSDVIAVLSSIWAKATAVAEDRISFEVGLRAAIKKHIPPHVFDGALDRAARSIGLEGLDLVEYRNKRLPDWRQHASFFDDPQAATAALERMLASELRHMFGDRPL